MNWILCDDKLPDKDGVYIVSGNVIVAPGDKPKPFSDSAEFVSWRAVPWILTTDTEGIYDYEIVAWMPLPSPLQNV